MRSDYKAALTEHLINEYLENNPDARADFNEEMARIQASYGDEDNEEARKKRQKDLDELRMDFAGRQMREILGDTGKLEQIYKTRRSGAANNAKDWLRKWVDLDNENALKREVDYYKAKREQEWKEEMQRRREADPSFDYEDKQLLKELKELGNFTEEQIPIALLLYHNYFNDYVDICNKLKDVTEPIYHICVDRDWLYYQWELNNFLDEVTIIDEEGDL
jgi:hypothetical protein